MFNFNTCHRTTSFTRHLFLLLALAASMFSVALPAAADSSHRGSVFGLGYAEFDVGGGPSDNWYRVDAKKDRHGQVHGSWEADVFIDFGGGAVFDFEATYTVDCLEIDRRSGEAWVEGTIVASNDPANVGNRAFLYIRDGGRHGDDLHAITPLADGVTCDQRPTPDFTEVPQRGNYRVR